MDESSDEDEHSKPPSWEGWSDDGTSFGLELQSPYAEFLLDGTKTIETRSYHLPPGLMRRRIDVLRSGRGEDGASSVPDRTTLTASSDDGMTEAGRDSPVRAGWCTFLRSFRYDSRKQFEADVDRHLVDPANAGYGWTESRAIYGWVVGDVGCYRRRATSLSLANDDDNDDDDNDDEGGYLAIRRFRSLFEVTREGRRRDEGDVGGVGGDDGDCDDDDGGGGPTILITGASGMLGRALHRLLLVPARGPQSTPRTRRRVIGVGHTRLRVEHRHEYFLPPPETECEDGEDDAPRGAARADAVQLDHLDLLDFDATTRLLDRYRPDVVVHCAAERRPDAFGRDPERSTKLNVESTRHLAKECARLANENRATGRGNTRDGPCMIYVSTEYVFDGGSASGEHPPYGAGSRVHPPNDYGRSKWEGERAVREVLNDPTVERGGRGIVVRIPLLYGEDCRDLCESPALETMEAFLPPASTTVARRTIDHWALRFPTSAEDVARVLGMMIERILEGEFPSVASSRPPGDTYHISSPHGTTKYELMRLQAELMGIPNGLVEERTAGDCDGPPRDAAPRPRCTQLDCAETWRALGLDGYEFASLERGMRRALDGFPERFAKTVNEAGLPRGNGGRNSLV